MNLPTPALAVELPWRTGRWVGRTIYAQLDDTPSESDLLIGVMDSRELALEAVQCHNKLLPGRSSPTTERQDD